jgi:hypothetical protein
MASATVAPSPVSAIAIAIIVLRISAPHSLCKSLARGLEGHQGEWKLNQPRHYCGSAGAPAQTEKTLRSKAFAFG